MKSISWLNLIGGLIAVTAAIAHFGGLAYLIKAVPLYFVMGIGIVLMVWDLVVSTREAAEKREASEGRELAAQR
ncbi:MAG TPA: hypothetical protein VIF14_12175 [Alphaproteobacteria bacterium]|jgi:hypothetical protein